MKQFIFRISLPLCLFLAACGNKSASTEKEPLSEKPAAASSDLISLTDAQLQNAGIVVALPAEKQISSTLQVNGRIDVPPQNMVSVNMPLGGYVRSTRLLPGMEVRKGQVLAVLEDPKYIEMQQEYLNAKTQLTLNKRDFIRQQTLKAGNAASEKVFQQAEADYSSQQVTVQGLAEKLRLIGINPDRLTPAGISRSINLYSPINGYVSKVLVNPGRYVSPADVLFELINPADIHLAITVFEKDLPLLAVGQSVIATTVNNPDKKHYATIILVGRDLSDDRSAQVHCHFTAYDKLLVPGTFMNAVVELQHKNVTALPADAIVRYEDKQYAFIQTGKGTFQMLEVQAGNTENDYTELRGDLAQYKNKSFVVKGAYALLMKAKNVEE